MVEFQMTGNQRVLNIVSVVTMVTGVTVASMGLLLVLVSLSGDPTGLRASNVINEDIAGLTNRFLTAYGLVIMGVGGLDIVISALGIRASHDSSKVGPYQTLVTMVTMMLLIALVTAFTKGKSSLLSLMALLVVNTAVAMVCFVLANRVNKDYLDGVFGAQVVVGEKTGRQRMLNSLSMLLILFAIIEACFGVLMLVPGDAAWMMSSDSGSAGTPIDATVTTINSFFNAGLDMVIGLMGLRGAKRPDRIGPFLVFSATGVVLYAASLAATLPLGFTFQSIMDLLNFTYMVICAATALHVMRGSITVKKP